MSTLKSSYFDAMSSYMYPSGLLHYFGVNGKVSGSIGAIGEMGGAVAILHGPRGCGFHYRNSARRRHQPFYSLYSTDLTEGEIIGGGAEKLRRTILEVRDRHAGELILVVPTPISDILNEDIAGVVEPLRAQGVPVIAVRSELFSHRDKQYSRRRLREISRQPVTGAKNLEMELLGCGLTEAMVAIVEQWMEPRPREPHTVNIETVGWGGEGRVVLREIGAFLEGMGIEVHCWLPSAPAEALKGASRARLNIVKRVRWAKRMQERFGTDYLHLGGAGRHHGLPGIRRFYEDVAEKLGLTGQTLPLLEAAEGEALAATAVDREYLGGIRCCLVCRNIQMAPHILRQYARDFGFRVEHMVLVVTPESERELGIDDDLRDTLIQRVRDAAADCGPVEIHLNPEAAGMAEILGRVDIVAGTSDVTYAAGGVPVLHSDADTTSLSFESYVRSVRRIRQRVENRLDRPDLLLNHLPFSTRYYPLLEDRNTIAAREMWSRMWLYRKGEQA